MAGFVLIHGAWHGGWCFDAVADRLRSAGHLVDAPTLPGMGGTAEELHAVTLEGWGRFAAERCRAMKARLGGGPVILAGHSRGGIVISTAAEIDPEAMDGLVYVCALMLPDGMSRVEFKAMEAPNPDFDAMIIAVEDGAGTLVDPTLAGAVFAQMSPPDLVEAALPRLTIEPHRVRSTPLSLSAERWGSRPRTYVECAQDRTIPLSSQRLMQELCPGARRVTLDCDHSPFLSDPDGLTGALLSALA
ncbi:MAG: alpha/beta fold hydrolase [Novosphingobium sp.]